MSKEWIRELEKVVEEILFSFEGVTSKREEESGGEGIEEPPVPIPNTEVKLNSVDGTWRATSRESRTLPDYDIPR